MPGAAAGAPLPESGQVRGRVVDARTGEPLIGANVQLKGASQGAATDLEGRFRIPNVPEGPQTFVASYIGYQKEEQTLEVPAGRTVELNFELDWEGSELGEVIVTAQAEGQLGAINQQINASTITNVVSAARIQEIPDVNAAESIGRLPGVSIQRSSGEANKVTVRGLSPKYNAITINGIRVPATDLDDRSVDLTMVSSNMLSGIELTKALLPYQDADAIGGTVNLRLREAPAGLQSEFLIQGGFNELQGAYDNYKINAGLSNRFLGDRLGAIVNGNLEGVDRSADQFRAGYSRTADRLEAESLRLNEHVEDRRRIGGSAVLDARLPGGKVSLNGFLSRLERSYVNRTNRYDTGNNMHRYDLSTTDLTLDLFTTALQGEQRLGPAELEYGAAYARSGQSVPVERSWQFVEQAGMNLQDFTRIEQLPAAANNNLRETYLNDVRQATTSSENTNLTLDAGIRMPFDLGRFFSGNVRLGGKYRRQERSNDESEIGANAFYGGSSPLRRAIAENIPEAGTVTESRFPMDRFIDNAYDAGRFVGGRFDLGFTPRLDMMNRVTEAALSRPNLLLVDANSVFAQDYQGEENLGAGYAMAEINLGRRLTFLPGVRYERMVTNYEAYQVVDVVPTMGQPSEADARRARSRRENSFWFPMLHLRIKPTGWMDLRLARTESLTRPDFKKMSPRFFVPTETKQPVIMGNPYLEPSPALNYDASLSFYSNHIGLFTISGFYKNISDLIWDTSLRKLPGVVIPAVAEGETAPGSPGQEVVVSINNPYDATVKGIEVDWQTNFWYLPNPFKGIVFNVNYSHILSETKYPRSRFISKFDPNFPPTFIRVTQVDTFRVGRLVDQPDNVLNVTLGYDLRGFSARMSALYQGNTLSLLVPEDLRDEYTDSYFRIDFSARQQITPWAQLFLNLNNLTAEFDQTFVNAIGGYPIVEERYGFTADLGLRFKF